MSAAGDRPPATSHPTAWTTWHWLRAPYPYLEQLKAAHGDTFSMRLLRFKLVVFSNPDEVKEIFADGGEDLLAGRFNRTLAPLLGDRSVLMADGREHRRKRKLLVPPFHGERMQAYGRTMLDESDRAIDAFPLGKPFRFHGFMQDITLRVIIRTIFGFDGPRAEEMAENTKRVLELGAWPPLLLPFMQKDYGRLTPYGRFKRAVTKSDRMLYEAIESRRKSGERGVDILSLLLDARDDDGEPMSTDELRDELVTLLVAGHETTATALTWALRWLLESPALLAELRAEIAALGPHPTPEALAKAELLDGTAREALRLVPIIPFVGRLVTKEQTIGRWRVLPGEVVVCSIYLAQRRPEIYPNPGAFDPKRFRGRKLSASEFFPFGGGLRRCIGMAFALYEMKMVLARIVARTRLAFADPSIRPGGPVKMVRRAVTMTPAKGLPVVLLHREPHGG